MRPKERRETGQSDLFRARLDQIVDRHHPVVKLARAIDWGFLEEQFGAVYTDEPGRPPLPTRLMAGLAILKHMHDPLGRGVMRALGREPVLPAVLRRGVLLP
jgi:IS5 family transposase